MVLLFIKDSSREGINTDCSPESSQIGFVDGSLQKMVNYLTSIVSLHSDSGTPLLAVLQLCVCVPSELSSEGQVQIFHLI